MLSGLLPFMVLPPKIFLSTQSRHHGRLKLRLLKARLLKLLLLKLLLLKLLLLKRRLLTCLSQTQYNNYLKNNKNHLVEQYLYKTNTAGLSAKASGNYYTPGHEITRTVTKTIFAQ